MEEERRLVEDEDQASSSNVAAAPSSGENTISAVADQGGYDYILPDYMNAIQDVQRILGDENFETMIHELQSSSSTQENASSALADQGACGLLYRGQYLGPPDFMLYIDDYLPRAVHKCVLRAHTSLNLGQEELLHIKTSAEDDTIKITHFDQIINFIYTGTPPEFESTEYLNIFLASEYLKCNGFIGHVNSYLDAVFGFDMFFDLFAFTIDHNESLAAMSFRGRCKEFFQINHRAITSHAKWNIIKDKHLRAVISIHQEWIPYD